MLMLLLPGFGQSPHGRCRQARRLRPEQRCQRLRELAGGHALQVEPGQQLLEVLRPAQVGRQDRRGEPDWLTAFRSTVTHLGPADLDRANAGLDLPLWRMTIAHEPPPAPLSTRPAWAARNISTSASMACISMRRAPSRSTASNGSSATPDPGLGRLTTVCSSMACPSGDLNRHRGYAASRLSHQIRL